MPVFATDALPMLDGSPSPITRAMLAASLLVTDASGLTTEPQAGDELWSYRMPGTDDFGQLLLRDGHVVEVTPASHTTLPSSVPQTSAPYVAPNPVPAPEEPPVT